MSVIAGRTAIRTQSGVIDARRSRSPQGALLEMAALEMERQRLLAYFEFFDENPGFLRLLNEAEVFAPLAYSEHIQRFSIRYIRALQKERDEGRLRPFDNDELKAVVFMLLGCRSYMTLLLKESKQPSSARLVDTYMKLIAPGLFRQQDH